MVDADLLGVVLNLLPTKGPDSYSYSYYSYGSSADSRLPFGKKSQTSFDEIITPPAVRGRSMSR
ncbi:hypothetical protein D3C75_1347460 [compost metagenome]